MKISDKLAGINLSRSQKILISLYDKSRGTKNQLRFEDIAVRAYQLFKSDFQLKGYPQYPDTGDIIHKPLYSELKKAGYVLSGNKYFSLTQKGLDYASQLLNRGGYLPQVLNHDQKEKFTAGEEKELEKIRNSAAFALFVENKGEETLDIDFYSYLGVTVRTNKYDFLGRLKSVSDAIEATKNKNDELYTKLQECHKFLLNKFKTNIDFVLNSKGGKR